MPVYEYRCTDCGEPLEVRQSFTDHALTVCPNCSGRLRKVLSPVGVVFKGSGFYRTDSRAAASAANGDGVGGSKKPEKDTSGDGTGDKGEKKDKTAPAAKETAATRNGSGSAGTGPSSWSSKASSTSKAGTS